MTRVCQGKAGHFHHLKISDMGLKLNKVMTGFIVLRVIAYLDTPGQQFGFTFLMLTEYRFYFEDRALILVNQRSIVLLYRLPLQSVWIVTGLE